MEYQEPMENLAAQKQALRRAIRSQLLQLAPECFKHAGQRAAEALGGHPRWQEARAVLLYASLPTEIDTAPLFRLARQKGKVVFFPKIEGEGILFYRVDDVADLEIQGPLGIPEPRTGLMSLADWLRLPAHRTRKPEPATGSRTGEGLPLCGIIPGLAFDRQGGRLGKGKGYYDRFLSSIGQTLKGHPPGLPPVSLYTIGLCLPLQMVDYIPRSISDMLVDEVVLVP